MLLFCPTCSNALTISQSTNNPQSTSSKRNEPLEAAESHVPSNILSCPTCPYRYAMDKRYFERKTFTRKEREDVFGGPGAWDNADKASMQCPAEGCDGDEAAFFQMQIRSADEPMTGFYKCMTCGNRWREN